MLATFHIYLDKIRQFLKYKYTDKTVGMKTTKIVCNIFQEEVYDTVCYYCADLQNLNDITSFNEANLCTSCEQNGYKPRTKKIEKWTIRSQI